MTNKRGKSISFETLGQICNICQAWNSKLNLCAPIHSSLLPNHKTTWKNKQWAEERVCLSGCGEPRCDRRYGHGGTGLGTRGRVTAEHCCQHTDSASHWAEQIAINLGLRYKYTQICTAHIQEKSSAFGTSATLQSRYLRQRFPRCLL